MFEYSKEEHSLTWIRPKATLHLWRKEIGKKIVIRNKSVEEKELNEKQEVK